MNYRESVCLKVSLTLKGNVLRISGSESNTFHSEMLKGRQQTSECRDETAPRFSLYGPCPFSYTTAFESRSKVETKI
ncbi:hypothetical protein PCAR4_830040 [Paraburkholderia caribensis]|nr:hypothetical protein PCAR4_830040 [Paraburkholderia caribensis]